MEGFMRSLQLSGSCDRHPAPFRPRLEALEDRNLPSTLTVTNLSDHDPGSLRDMINQAQDGDTILFDPSVRGTITLETGDLLIDKSITILGPGADQLAISGNHRSRDFYIDPSTNVSISNLAILAGLSSFGGGVYVPADATLSLTACLVRDNASYYGGGIYNEGTVTIQDSNLSWNSSDYVGGAVYNDGQLTVSGTLLDHNSAQQDGGGVVSGWTSRNGFSSVIDSIIQNCSATNGGGIASYQTAFVVRTVVQSCFASNNGGGIAASLYPCQLTDCDLTGNSAGRDGGGLYSSHCDLTVNTSTFSNNTVTGDGGGLRVDRQAVSLSRITLSGNQAGGDGGALYNSSFSTLVSSTVYGNHAARDGAGIYNDTALAIDNTIVAGNFRTNSTYATDLDGFAVDPASAWNLIGIGGSGGMINGVNNNQVGVANVGLSPLADNGGHAWTMAPLAGSPALNAGDPALIGSTDERGVTRTGGVNIGAYQASATWLTITTDNNATAGEPFQLTVTAYDVFGQVVVGYTGTIVLSRTDGPDPVAYTFTAADAGSHTFVVMVENPGPVSFFVRDRDNDGIYGGEIDLTV
jgi:hypothetical protein